MISLNPIPSNQPLNPGDNLIEHLAVSARPAIIQYSKTDRVELSGRVTINWATKMTHLMDSYGTVASDTLFIDLPVTWRSLALVLGAAWCDLEFVAEATQATAILTDRPDRYLAQPAEIFVTHRTDVDAALVDVDDEVLSHADQPLLSVPDIIGNARTETPTGRYANYYDAGAVIYNDQLRLDTATWWTVIDTWRRTYPVILVDSAAATGLQRIIQDERLGAQQ